MIEELSNNFATLLTQYPSGNAINNLLVSKYFGIKQEYIQVGNGAAELIRPLMKQLSGKIGIILPTFEEYPNRYDSQKLVFYQSANSDFRYSADDLIDFYSRHPISGLLIVNPDNPSGNFLDATDLHKLLKWSQEQKIRLVIDESFIDFAEDTNCSLLDNELLRTNPQLIVMISISKSYGVPGLRLGILATANEQLLKNIQADLPIWNLNSFAEFYLQIFGKYEKEYQKSGQKFRAERQRFGKKLQQIPYLKVYSSQANYFLCEVIAPFGSTELVEKLLKNSQILLKDCSSKQGFAGKSYVRIAVRSTSDNNFLLEQLKQLC